MKYCNEQALERLLLLVKCTGVKPVVCVKTHHIINALKTLKHRDPTNLQISGAVTFGQWLCKDVSPVSNIFTVLNVKYM